LKHLSSGYYKPDLNRDTDKIYPKSIQRFKSIRNAIHPTQKPVALFEYLIKTYTNEGNLVLDNCIGSGTTAVAAINTGRNFIGIEMDKSYCDIANKRIQEARSDLASKLPL
jgi:site-specific DNA-methyltransferase (adenine-specific)